MKQNFYQRHGTVPVFGILVSHSWDEIGAVMNTIWQFQVDCVVEIGIHRGGLGAMLHAYSAFNPNLDYLGIEIDEEIVHLQFMQIVPNILIGDAFNPEIIRRVQEFIEDAKKPMIYCDGGDKPREYEVYRKILPSGGLIMVHDYPIEFNEKHFSPELSRISGEYLDCCRQVLFEK